MAIFKNTPPLVTNGMVLYVDGTNPQSYISGSTIWNDLSLNKSNLTLTSASFSNLGGGSINFNNTRGTASMSTLMSLPNWSVCRVYQNNPQANVLDTGERLNDLPLSTSSSIAINQRFSVFSGINCITIDNSNNIYVGSSGLYKYQDVIRFLIVKINSTGSINTTFELSGFNELANAGQAVGISNILLRSNNEFGYLASDANLTSQTRFNTTTGERVVSQIPNQTAGSLGGKSLFLDEPNNHIYVGLFGNFSYSGISYVRMARLNIDTLVADPTFNTTDGFNNEVESACLDTINNKIYCVGSFTSYKGQTCNRIVRLNMDGSIDNTFNTGTGFNDIASRIFLDSSNKPIISGRLTSYNGTTSNRIIRLNLDGSIDNTFNTGTGFNASIVDMKYSTNYNKIYCVGNFISYNGTGCNRIARLNLDGSIDNTFNIGTGFNNTTNAIGLQTDDKIVIGASPSVNTTRTFTGTYNGTQFASLIRLNYDGTVDSSFNTGLGFTEGTYRNELLIRYFTSEGAAQTLIDLSNFPSFGRSPISRFQEYYTNKFHYSIITKDIDNVYRVYEDGILRRTLTVPAGSNTNLVFQRLSGMDNVGVVQIYNRALSAQEITQNYNSMKSRFNLT